MDEYLGLSPGSEYLLSNFAQRYIFSQKDFKGVFPMNGANTDFKAECDRYTRLLQKHPLDIVCLGIGENGHLAYNDPHIADFNDPFMVKIVEIDEKSRWQAVHDGVFPTLSDVPKAAMTVTLPVMMNARFKSVVAPGPLKANAIRDVVYNTISTDCPASILRKYECTLFTDEDGAGLI